jgi:hypothetical protein
MSIDSIATTVVNTRDQSDKDIFIQALNLWTLAPKMQVAISTEEFQELEALQRILTIRNGIISGLITLCRNNDRHDCRGAVYTVIATMSDNKNFRCNLTIKRIAQLLSRSERQIREAINWLEGQGVLTVTRTANGLPNSYAPRIANGIQNSNASVAWFVDAFSERPRSAGRPKKALPCETEKTPEVDLQGFPKTPEVDLQGFSHKNVKLDDAGKKTPEVQGHSISLLRKKVVSKEEGIGIESSFVPPLLTHTYGSSFATHPETCAQVDGFGASSDAPCDIGNGITGQLEAAITEVVTHGIQSAQAQQEQLNLGLAPQPEAQPIAKPKKSNRAKAAGYSEQFEQAWLAYPRTPTMSKAAAWKSWQREKCEEIAQAVIDGSKAEAARCDREGVEPRFRKHMQGWLSERRWEGMKEAIQEENRVSEERAIKAVALGYANNNWEHAKRIWRTGLDIPARIRELARRYVETEFEMECPDSVCTSTPTFAQFAT